MTGTSFPPRPDVADPPRPDLSVPVEAAPPGHAAPPDHAAPRAPDATWGILEMVPVLLMPYGATLILLSLLRPVLPTRSAWVFLFEGLFAEAAFAGAVLYWLRYVKREPLSILGRPHRPFGEVVLGCMGGAVMLGASGIATAITLGIARAIAGHRPTSPPLFPKYVHGPWVAAFGPVLFLVAPVAEELLFRGVLFKGFRRRLRFAHAALLSAAVFAILHIDPIRYPGIFVAGLVLAFLYERSQSLLTPMVAHATNNLLVFILIVSLR